LSSTKIQSDQWMFKLGDGNCLSLPPVTEALHPRHLSEDFFLDSLPLLRRELLPISLLAIFQGSQYDSLSLSAPPRACGSF
jgi:hypothetical protein